MSQMQSEEVREYSRCHGTKGPVGPRFKGYTAYCKYKGAL